MPSVLWNRIFLESQGYGVTDNIIYQDNNSDIILENNDNSPNIKCNKYINFRYVFVIDRIHKGDMSVEWYPTGEMTGYFLTKPNQGSIFKEFRDLIMVFLPQNN